MKRQGRKKEWSVVLFCISLLFFMPPVLSIFDRSDLVFGLPIAYMVLFGAWLLIIVLVGLRAKQKTTLKQTDQNGDP